MITIVVSIKRAIRHLNHIGGKYCPFIPLPKKPTVIASHSDCEWHIDIHPVLHHRLAICHILTKSSRRKTTKANDWRRQTHPILAFVCSPISVQIQVGVTLVNTPLGTVHCFSPIHAHMPYRLLHV